jgi:hypothetical protein
MFAAPAAPAEPAKAAEPAVSAAEPAKLAEPVVPTKGKPDSVRSMSDKIDAVIKADKADKANNVEAAAAETVAKGGQDTGAETLNKEIEAETKHMGAKEKAAWTKLRYENRDYARKLKEAEMASSKVAELEAKIADAAKAPATSNQELEALRTRLAEAEQILAIKDVESTQEFQNAVTKPKAAIEDMARALAAKYSANETDILNALNDTSDKRSDLLSEVASGMNEVDRYDFYAAARAVKELKTKADAFRANSKEALAQINAQNQTLYAQDTAAQAQAREAAHGAGWAELQKAVPILTPAEGDDDITKNWNAEITNAETFARESNYNQFDVNSQVAIMHRASVYPLLVGAVTSLQDELKNAHMELQKLRGSRPGAGGGVAAMERTSRKPGSTDFVDRVNDRIAALGH